MDTIHGLTFIDYAATNAFLAQGKSIEELLPTLGVEEAQWVEASAHFEKAMSEDTTFELTGKLGEVFQNPEQGKYAQGADGQGAKGVPVPGGEVTTLEDFLDLQAYIQVGDERGLDPQALLKERGLTMYDYSQVGVKFGAEIRDGLMDETDKGEVFREWYHRTTAEVVERYRAEL